MKTGKFNENESQENGKETLNEEMLYHASDVFAELLSRKFGYKMEQIIDSLGSLCHVYCVTESDGKTLYIDSRGVTDDYGEFIKEFAMFLPSCERSKNVVLEYKDGAKKLWGREFLRINNMANKLYKAFPQYYNLKQA